MDTETQKTKDKQDWKEIGNYKDYEAVEFSKKWEASRD